jgi:hypothetical protein
MSDRGTSAVLASLRPGIEILADLVFVTPKGIAVTTEVAYLDPEQVEPVRAVFHVDDETKTVRARAA